jgi:hypothetical protein
MPWDNAGMGTNTSTPPPADVNGQDSRTADAATVLEQFATGRPLDPAAAERVRARAAEVTEEIRRARGTVDDDTFQPLLDDEA